MNDANTFDTFDHVIPKLRPGAYTVRVTQEIAGGDAPPVTEAQAFAFTVVAPRLRFADDEVHASFPPTGGEANYKLTLPHVVLKRRALPWEQRVGPDAATPWLALIVLGEAELAGDARLVTGTAALVAPPAAADAVLRPVFDPPLTDVEKKESITCLEMSEALFRRLCPTLAELPALAHVRRVDLADKPDPGAARQGDFAVVVAKRFPDNGGNTAVLVALAGWDAWLAAGTADPVRRVRAVVLHAWPFKSLDTGPGTFRGRVEQIQRRGPLAIPAEDTWSDAVKRTLGLGFVPVAHQPSGGPRSVAWYRGPLAPVAVAARPGHEQAHDRPPRPMPLADGDGAQPDISHLSAWHLGRLLALSSATYTSAVRRWSHVKGLERMKAGTTGDPGSLALVKALAGYLEARRDSDPDKATDPLLRDAMAIAEWLGRLILMIPVPLRYLVPSGRALPSEALCGFCVDPSWTIDALATGALAYSAASLRPTDVRWTCDELRTALWRLFEFQRQILANGRKDTHAVPTAEPMTGFLLRSRLLQEYPGVEITLWSGTTRIRPLRCARLADDVLLVLAYGKPGEIRLREPREGLRFGCEKEWKLQPLPDLGATPPPMLDLKLDYCSKDAPAVLDVAAVARQLGTAGSGAGFARHWLRRPTDYAIAWEHAP